jgi:hypothetical protein
MRDLEAAIHSSTTITGDLGGASLSIRAIANGMNQAFWAPFLGQPVAWPAANCATTRGPNVILILTKRSGLVGSQVHSNTVSRLIMDRLAGESVRFTQFYACPVCSPTRAGLMTGRCQRAASSTLSPEETA